MGSGWRCNCHTFIKITIMSIGIPAGIENGMFQFGKIAIQSTVSTMGTTVMPAQAMTNIFEMANGLFANGVGIGLMTVVGQCIGANRVEEAKHYKRSKIMKNKILYACLSISILINAQLVMYIINMEPPCEHIHYDDIDRTKDIVPDEDTVRRIAETVLRMEKSAWGLKEDHYYTDITYNEAGHEWIVIFSSNSSGSDKERVIGIRKDYGIITEYDKIHR